MPKPTKSKPAAKQPKSHPSYAPKDIVLGKVRGYPPWPGRIVDPADAPPRVKSERPGKSAAANGISLVQFFPTGDFSWLGPKDISKLLPHEIESYINDPVKKSGDLLAGYRIALDPTEWEAKRPQLPTADEDEDADADADGEEDELASEPSEGKRKRKPAAAKKSGRKSKKPVEAESEDEGAPPTKKAKKSKKDDGAKKGKDEDAEGEIDADEAPKSQAEEVRDWRHRLQKTFLGHKAVPKETEMPSMDALFTTIENYHEMTVEQLTFSKIGKVMRHITILTDDKLPVGADATFRFRERAKALVDRWQQVLGTHRDGEAVKNSVSMSDVVPPKEETTLPSDKPTTDAPLTNGEVKTDDAAPTTEVIKEESATLETTAAGANGTAADPDDKMVEDKKPDVAAGKDELMDDAFMGDLTMDMSVEP